MPDVGQHYFSEEPLARSTPRQVELTQDGRIFTFLTDAGVFSCREVDLGTRVLLAHAPLPDLDGDVLDLGCGYGPIAVTLAARLPRTRVWAVDVNTRAVALAAQNAVAAGLDNVSAGGPDLVPAGIRFAAIYSNPPIRIGKAGLHELLATWLPRLAPDGSACLVVARNLGADSLGRWLAEEQGYRVARLRSQKGYRLLSVRPPALP